MKKRRRKNNSQDVKKSLTTLLRDPRADDTAWEILEESGSRTGGKGSRRYVRRKTPVFYKVLAVVFIVGIVLGSVFIVRNFGSASRAHKQGMEAYQNGDYNNAVSYFTQAVGFDKSNKVYQLQLGQAQIKNAMFDEALVTFEEIRDNSRNSMDKQSAIRGIGITYLYKGEYAKSVEALTEAMTYANKKYSVQDMDIAYYLAEAQNKNGDSVGAVLTYTEIINQKGGADAYMLRGMAYQNVGDNTNAEADLTKALELSQKNYKVYMTLYEVLMAEGKLEEAKDVLEEATELTAKTSEDFSNKGLIYVYLGDYEKAEAHLERALNKNYIPAYFGKAQLAMTQGMYEDAVSNFNTYFEQVTDNALAYNQYGVCMMKLGKYEEATTAFTKGLELNDRTVDQEMRANQIVAFERMSNWSAAYESAKVYVEKYPDDEQGKKELVFIESRLQ